MNSPDLRFVCPQCARPIRCDGRLAGREVHCPDCQQLLVIPHPAQGGRSFVGEREVAAAPTVRPVVMTSQVAVGALLGTSRAWYVRRRGELALAGVGLLAGTVWLLSHASVYLPPTLPGYGLLGLLLYGLWHTRGSSLSGRRQALGLLLLAATLSALAVSAARTTGASATAWGLGLLVVAGGLFCWTGWSIWRCLLCGVVLLAFPLSVGPMIRAFGPLLIANPWRASRGWRWLRRVLAG